MLVDSQLPTRTDTITSTNSFASSAPTLVLTSSESITGGGSSVNGNGNGTSNGHDNKSDSADRGLSTGAKAAIGACIPLVAIFAGLALFAFLRRRSRRNATGAQDITGAPTAKKPSAYDGAKMKRFKAAMSGTPMSPDRSVNVSPGASVGGISELHGSTVSPRLHEHIMELPADFNAHGAARPRTDQPPSFN